MILQEKQFKEALSSGPEKHGVPRRTCDEIIESYDIIRP